MRSPYAVSSYLREVVVLEPAEAPGDLRWQDKALCAQVDPEIFFPEKGGSTREAKRVCQGCDVRAECLDYALEHEDVGRFGIWGGLSERERRSLRPSATDPGFCGNGLHVMDEKNTYVNPGTGWKNCRACSNASARHRKQEQKYEREAAA